MTVSDIFAVGVIAFELLAGFRPYRSDNPDEGPLTFLTRYARVAQGAEPRPSLAASTPGRDDIPAAWIQTIDRAIDVSPDKRPQTIREFIEPLYRALPDGEAIARQLAPGLFAGASPSDATHRAVRGDATRPGVSTAPHVAAGPSTFHSASGQVATPQPARVRRALPAAIVGALAVGVVVVAIVAAAGSRSDSPTAAGRTQDAVDAGTANGATVDAATVPIVAAPIDATTATDAAKDAAPTVRKRHAGRPRSPDDID